MKVTDWKQILLQLKTRRGECPIEKIDDDKRIIEIKPDIPVEVIREIQGIVSRMEVPYEIRQLQ